MRPSRCLPAIAAPYELTKESAELLSAAAREDCGLCKGTGVSGWKSRGRKPEVCRCAREAWRANADEMAGQLTRALMQGPRNPAGAVLVKTPGDAAAAQNVKL